jgi:FtsZ-interacting cell division protein ZipA
MQDINIPLIVITVVVLIALLLFLNRRNRRDRKKLFPPESTDPVEENKTEKEMRRDIS